MTEGRRELLGMIADNVPKKFRAQVRPESRLRDLGIDSLTLVVIVSQFLDRYPSPVEKLEARLGQVRTVEDLLAVGDLALELARGARVD